MTVRVTLAAIPEESDGGVEVLDEEPSRSPSALAV
jgi:hypothetical protein